MAYTSFFVFGDSLVDAGNALRLAQFYGDLTFSDLPDGAPDPALGYFAGRFSNGYTFADLLANKTVGTVTKPIFPYGYEDPWLGIPIAPWAPDPTGNTLNFAYGGAQVLQGNEVVPDLDGQTDAFKNAVDKNPDSNALYLVTMGGNDVRNLVPRSGDPVAQAQAHAALDAVAQQLINELSGLVRLGVENILITGIPDVGLIPNYDRNGDLVLDATEQMRTDAATDYSIYLDTLLRTLVVPALEALGAIVTYAPLMDYVDEDGNQVTGALTANLVSLAALHGLTTEQLSANLLQHQDVVFFDDIHPNAQAHALLGAYIYSQLTAIPWIETLPLTSVEVDYSLTATISAPGEADTVTIAMVAGTTYAFDMLGMSALGTAGSLGDPLLMLFGAGGTLLIADDDSGVGFDAALTFIAPGTGNYTLELTAVGSLTGSYLFQAAVVSGAAMLAGNAYVVNSPSVLVLEGAGGVGTDVVMASVSFALAQGSEIEQLRTTNDRGKTSINLTGNEFDQVIVGNAGSNVIDGRSGSDVLYGGAGKDVFVVGEGALGDPTAADAVADYGRGDIIDVSSILIVADGTVIDGGGFARITSAGELQVDVDGGGDDWFTLSSVSGTGNVTIRYMSGDSQTELSIPREGSSGGGKGGAGKSGNVYLSLFDAPTSADWVLTPFEGAVHYEWALIV